MVIIIVWMFLFAFVHSLTADGRIKQAFAQLFGERAYFGTYRLIYNIVSAVMLAPLLLYMASSVQSQTVWEITGITAILFVGVQLIGLVGLVVSLIQIDWARFAGLKQIIALMTDQQLPLPNEPLQTNGIYGLVRHPLYFFSMLAMWFIPVMTDVGLVFTITVTLYFIIGSRIEEARMLNAYGQQYADYQARVPWLIPLTISQQK